MSSQVIVNIMSDIVGRVSAKLTPQLSAYDNTIVGVNFMYGPPKEIIRTLQGWNGTSKAQAKYPIVALYQPFVEDKGGDPSMDAVENIRMIIGRQSDPTWLTDKRYAVNFIPVLYPIYDELMNQIYDDPNVNTYAGRVKHKKTDWPFFDDGKDANPFGDWLDVVEIKNMMLNIELKNECN
jgi:hypothetical protein